MPHIFRHDPLSFHRRAPARVGFTLIEALVGITLLLTVLTATLSAASANIGLSGFSREQVTAFFLGQEALEIVRNVRDSNTLSGATSWLSGLDSCVGTMCTIDATNVSSPASSCGVSCPPLKLSSIGIYQYGSGADSPFTREVGINLIVPDREAVVTVTVKWDYRGVEKSIIMQDHLLNWQ